MKRETRKQSVIRALTALIRNKKVPKDAKYIALYLFAYIGDFDKPSRFVTELINCGSELDKVTDELKLSSMAKKFTSLEQGMEIFKYVRSFAKYKSK